MADERGREEGRRTRLEGRLEGDSVTGLFRLFSERQATGVLCFEREERECCLYLQGGRIIFATSNDPNHRLGEMLLRQGRIGFRELERAVGGLGKGRRLGTLLVEDGALAAQGLVQAVVDQVREVVLGLIDWQQGRYEFREGPLPTQEVITLDLSTPELILQGIGQVEDWDRIRRAVGSPRSLLERGPALERGAEDTPELGSTESAILEKLDRPKTVDELCREVFASSFEVYRSVWALRCLDLVRRREREYPRPLPGEIPRQGRLESVGMPLLLLEICRAGETGLLRVWGPAGERSVHLKDGTVVFATSSDPNDGLVSYLLRRGVIGVKDRDEAARRLLSNKRIGTLLVERGSVTGAELEQYVREQVLEIVLGLFTWERGEYAFEEGELPTLEEITLDSSVETLVLHGVLRVERWPGIVEGLGDLQGVYRLRPDYLDCLDRTEIGPGEWDMISLLKEERSLWDLCRNAAFSDYQTARVVWALLLIGVLERVPEEELRERKKQAAREREEAEALAGAEPLSEEADEPSPEEREDLPSPEEERSAGEAEAESRSAEVLEEVEEVEEDPIPLAPSSEGNVEAPVAAESAEPAEQDDAFKLEDVAPGANRAPVLFAEDEPGPGREADSGREISFELAEPGASTTPGWAQSEAADSGDEVMDFDLVRREEESEEVRDPGEGLEGPEERLATETDVFDQPFEEPFEEPVEEPNQEPVEEAEPMPTLDLEEPAVAEVDLAATMRLDASTMAPADLPAVSREEPDSMAEQRDVRASTEAAPPEEAEEAEEVEAVEAVEAVEETEETALADELSGDRETPSEEEGPDLPQDHLDREILRFNEKHRFLFDHLKAEIGAGARNFVSTCQRRAGDELSSMFEGCSLGPEGEYDSASLRRNIFDQNIDAYPHVFERLLHAEFDMVRDLLPPDRLERIESGLREIDDRFRP